MFCWIMLVTAGLKPDECACSNGNSNDEYIAGAADEILDLQGRTPIQVLSPCDRMPLRLLDF